MTNVILNPLPQKTISEVKAGFAQSYHGYWNGEGKKKKDDPLRHLKETYVFIFVCNMIVLQIK